MKEQLGVHAAEPPGGVAGDRVSGWLAALGALRSPGRAMLEDLITTVFPGDCQCCAGPLERAGTVPVCDACVGRVVPYEAPGCWRCGEAEGLSLDLEDMRFARAVRAECRVCKSVPPDFARAVSYGVHDAELRELIALLKFNRVRGVAELLGGRLAEAVLQLEGEAAGELVVVAVPLFAARERWRGFNQSVLLADAALKRLRQMRPGWKMTRAHRLLKRVRETESSFRLSPKGRRENLRGAFQVTGEVLGREVLLIDDIYTSGATARECARMLMRAGASKVWVATLARAQKESAMREQQGGLAEQVAAWDMPATTAVQAGTTTF